RLRVWSENRAITLRKRADEFTASALLTFAQLGGHLNKVTGYDEIEVLKRRVAEQEARIFTARQRAREAKKAHEEAVIQRSKSQREVNELLQRKSTWTEQDVTRFTTLVREDHSYEQNEARCQAEAALAEEQVEREFSELMQSILARYHEEQVWSDKIRSASTYGSLAALGLNLLVFVLAIVIVEPWKRRRLAQTFEKKIEEMSVENRDMIEGGMRDLSRHFETQEQFL
ncbi:mitochondrial distribution and morphology family 33, partial [Heliocybe sulcata]